MRNITSTLIASAGILALTFGTAPAFAATLPATDRVYILPCDDEEYDGLLYQVDTVSGVATRIGDWVNPDTDIFSCAGPGAYNPANGLGYWISWAPDNNAFLISVDLTTGVNTLIGQFTLGGEPYYTPIALAIDSAGNAWATSFSSIPDVLLSVNLTTAVLTEVGPTGVTPESDNYGLAWDSVTNAVYGYNLATRDFFTVNTATGNFTLFNDDVLDPPVPYALAFDSAGQVWGINGDIISAPLADLDDAEILTVINPYTQPAQGDIYSESIIIAPAPAEAPSPGPQLADSGAVDSAIAAAGIAGLLFLIAGVVVSRRHATRVQ